MFRDASGIVASIKGFSRPLTYNIPPAFLRLLNGARKRFIGARMLLRIARFLRTERFDIIQVNLTSMAWILRAFSGGSAHYVYDVRQINEKVRPYNWWQNIHERLVGTEMTINAGFVFDHACFCHADAARRVLGEKWESRGTVVPVGVDGRFLGYPLRRLNGDASLNVVRFVYIGGLDRDRTLEQLLEAADALRRTTERFHLDLVGPDLSSGYYAQLIQSLGLGAYVGTKDAVKYGEIPELLAHYDVGVAYVPDRPTWHYQPATKVIEYRAFGLPIISTDVSSHREYVQDNVNGFLVADSPEAISRAMERLVVEPSTLPRLKKNASAMRSGVTWDDIGAMYDEDVYRRLARGKLSCDE
ncbi:glycosyltransferase family 4 protein [Thiocapsa rosea]|uniref:glycosyltransferase family 4 protein n=1 Tax=Thiocapsa rosea TaxID=69360 RepID=UPI001475A228|nr:glycosyltransferase family 4 protein [Thiocapsa rosea]